MKPLFPIIGVVAAIQLFFGVRGAMAGKEYPLINLAGESVDGAHLAVTVSSAGSGVPPFALDDPVSIAVELTPREADMGRTAEIFCVALTSQGALQMNSERAWVPWSGEVNTLVSAAAPLTLSAHIPITVLDSLSHQPGRLQFYVAYRLTGENDLYHNKRAITVDVSPFTSLNTTVDLQSKTLFNEAAYIPSQCYTNTIDETSSVHNPCYACHLDSNPPNYINDWELQLEYAFPEYALDNHWTNLFKDRSTEVASISDQEIVSYVRNDNYLDHDGKPILAEVLGNLPAEWDADGDGAWEGYTPDCYYTFDDQGFDHRPDGSYSGWRAFAYYPFLGTFWPTNGATDDVLIRLGEDFRTNEAGHFDLTAYKINLAIVEALISKRDVAIDPVDEKLYGVDLDKDGALGTASRISYDWAPLDGRTMSYVGQARLQQQQGKVHLAALLFPEETEFLHSVRYIDVTEDGAIALAPRMKELRYARKAYWMTYSDLLDYGLGEMKDRHDFPDRLRLIIGNMEQGVSNSQGWIYQGFIEDANGNLRPQTYEENVFCIGCHGGMGVTMDGIFSFPRKFSAKNAFQQGWYHWSQKGLAGINEPKVEIEGAGIQYEYSFYLIYNKSGNEFRTNDEVFEKFYNTDLSVKEEMLVALHDDITELLNPSPQRALMLNKAYRAIVAEQSFREGRDPIVEPADNVWQHVATNQPTGIVQATNPGTMSATFANSVNTLASIVSPPSDAFKTLIVGAGMSGPNGAFYGVDWNGLIHRSDYGVTIENFLFAFPPRLTLPTRIIVPNDGGATCYRCHRLSAPMVPANEALVLAPVTLPATEEAEEEAGMLTRLTDDGGEDTGGVWSPDGSRIAWTTNRGGTYQIWVMNADGSAKQAVTSGSAIHGWPAWSPDGKRVAYWEYEPVGKLHAVKHVAVNGGDVVTIAQSQEIVTRPDWSPDGRHIAYSGVTGGNWDIWLSSVDGSSHQRLTTSTDMESNPLWRPDGGALAYKVGPATGDYTLTKEYFMTFENGFSSPTVHAWNGPESVQMNDWSPDGGSVAYTAEAISDASGEERVSYLAVISDVTLNNGQAVTSNTKVISQGQTLGDRGPVLSPDGSKVAFWAWDTSYRATLWLYDKKSGKTSRITTSGHDMTPQWSPDGSQLLCESSRNGNLDLWLVSLE